MIGTNVGFILGIKLGVVEGTWLMDGVILGMKLGAHVGI